MTAYNHLPIVQFSFIVPTFNRKNLINNAINSALTFINNDHRYEIIIADDGSTDGTFEEINEKYHNEIFSRRLKILKLEHNCGVVAARNHAAQIASGRWLLMLDSDNEIIPDNKYKFESTLASLNYPVILFRCINDSGILIGPENMEQVLYFRSALNGNYPEFFGVCERESFLAEYSKSDVVALRRFEAIAYYRTLKKHRSFYISDLIMRRYSSHAPDRLSAREGVVKDAKLLLAGHFILLKEHWNSMSLRRFFFSLGALFYYLCMILVDSIKRLFTSRV